MLKILLLSYLLVSPALATPVDDDDNARFPSSYGESLKWSVGATADAQAQYFPDALSPAVEQKFGILNAELNGTVKSGKKYLVKARPTAHWDPNNPTKSEQSWYDLPEGYFQLKSTLSERTSATFQLGYNTFTWGVTDGYNPIDVVSARRYSDPLHSEKLGAFSLLARMNFAFDDFQLLVEGIYIPWQRRSTLPGENSRWLPREFSGPVQNSGVTVTPPASPDFSFREPLVYDNALRNNLGLRLSSHFLGMDAAAYVFDGASTLPAVAINLDIHATALDPVTFQPTQFSAGSQIGLVPLFNRVTVTGVSVVFPLSELIVRAELAVTKAYRKGSSKISEKNTEAVGELEHTFTVGKGSLTALGLMSWADPEEPQGQTITSASFTRLFDTAVGGGLRWQPNEVFSAEGFGGFDVKHGGEIFRGELGYKLTDAWKVYGAGELLIGTLDQPIGSYRKNSRAIAGLKVTL